MDGNNCQASLVTNFLGERQLRRVSYLWILIIFINRNKTRIYKGISYEMANSTFFANGKDCIIKSYPLLGKKCNGKENPK